MKRTKKSGASVGVYPFPHLLKEVSARSGIPLYKVRLVVDTFVDVIKERLYERKSIQIPKLGVFFLRKLKGRLYNVVLKGGAAARGERTFTYRPERLAPVFKFAKAFVDQIMKDTSLELQKLTDLEDLLEED